MSSPVSHEPVLRSLPGSAPSTASGAITGVVSVLLHAVTLAAILVLPLMGEGRLPDHPSQVEAFFAAPLELAPPPAPPPPPSPSRAAARVPVKPPSAAGFVAPVEVPTEVRPEAGLDLGTEGGVAGGADGGVPGGIVGGLPEAPLSPPPEPVRVGLNVKEPRKLKDVPPVYPMIAAKSRLEGVVILECIIDVRGRVADVKVLRGLPVLDEAAVEAVRHWVYTPSLVDGVPSPVIMTVTVNFRLNEGR